MAEVLPNGEAQPIDMTKIMAQVCLIPITAHVVLVGNSRSYRASMVRACCLKCARTHARLAGTTAG